MTAPRTAEDARLDPRPGDTLTAPSGHAARVVKVDHTTVYCEDRNGPDWCTRKAWSEVVPGFVYAAGPSPG